MSAAEDAHAEAADESEAAAPTGAEFEALMTLGRGGFVSNCSSCHGSNGQGDLGPSLVGNELLGDASLVADTIINGFSYMPPFGGVLNDDQVAAIATYIRNSWGNSYGPVSAEEAQAER